MVADYLAIAAGGALGSLLRYVFALGLADATAPLPWHTLAVNVSGSLLLGWVARSNLFGRRQALFVMVGFLGSFTTFSTLALELTQQAEQSAAVAAIYAGTTMLLGLAAAWIGSEIAIRQAANR